MNECESKKNIFKDLENYIEEWERKKDKPDNEAIFIQYFIEFLDHVNCDDMEFHGSGDYFGKVITIHHDISLPMGGPNELLCFEITYSSDKICVYTAFHSGFYVQPYLEIEKDCMGFSVLWYALEKILFNFFGLTKTYLFNHASISIGKVEKENHKNESMRIKMDKKILTTTQNICGTLNETDKILMSIDQLQDMTNPLDLEGCLIDFIKDLGHRRRLEILKIYAGELKDYQKKQISELNTSLSKYYNSEDSKESRVPRQNILP